MSRSTGGPISNMIEGQTVSEYVATLDPAATYSAFVVNRRGQRRQFAIVSGENAAQMLRDSTDPSCLRFTLAGE